MRSTAKETSNPAQLAALCGWFAARDGSAVKSHSTVHNTASYAGHQNSDGFSEQNNNSASASRFSVNVSGAPNDGFLLNTLKTLFQVFYPEYL